MKSEPAFPSATSMLVQNAGMSLRQWYKGMALSGLCAAMADRDNITSVEVTATQAALYADAMLAEDAEHEKKETA